jgi:hypothetical protein
MMKHRIAAGASLACALLISSAFAADALKSGPQPGDKLTPFNPQNITGDFAGKKQCLV